MHPNSIKPSSLAKWRRVSRKQRYKTRDDWSRVRGVDSGGEELEKRIVAGGPSRQQTIPSPRPRPLAPSNLPDLHVLFSSSRLEDRAAYLCVCQLFSAPLPAPYRGILLHVALAPGHRKTSSAGICWEVAPRPPKHREVSSHIFPTPPAPSAPLPPMPS